jgi:aldehyde dehydrogenase (NAD+)/aldehyde dehydrogenase
VEYDFGNTQYVVKIAQVMEDNLEYLATLETIDNGKPIRESRAADIPLY